MASHKIHPKGSVTGQPLVVVAEPLAQSGMSILRDSGLNVREAFGASADDLPSLLPDAQALIVRSKTHVTGALLRKAPLLRVVGRAGVGVDSIDVNAATDAGIIVLNTPDASTLATAEHTMALVLALCRHVPEGQERLRQRSWSARDLAGVELADKTLGIIGLGRIGAAVALRGRSFGMTVVAHDAVASEARAESLGVKLASLDDVLRRADFVTLHAPLTAQTMNLIGAQQIALMKPGARLINCARGGLVDEAALRDALDSGRIAGAALDVVAEEPPQSDAAWALLNHPRVVATPHLGGSTLEAQDRIAADLCRDVVAVLRGQPPSGAVNAPLNVPVELRPFVELAHRLGAAFPQVCDECDLSHLDLMLEGDLAAAEGVPFVVSFLVGLLPHLTDERVSAVNAQGVARRLGIVVEALGAPCDRGFAKALTVIGQRAGLAGTVIHGNQLRFIDVDGFEIDVAPQGPLLLTRHRDVPGIVGKVGTVLGAANINISTMQVARREGGSALLLAAIDRVPDAPILARLRGIDNVSRVTSFEL